MQHLGNQGSTGSVASNPPHADSSTKQTEGSDSRLSMLAARLKGVSTTRSAVIQAAREKLERGDYTTSQAAEQLARTTLHSEIF